MPNTPHSIICYIFLLLSASYLPSKSVFVILIPTAATTKLQVGDQFEETYLIPWFCNAPRSQGQYYILK